MTHWALPPAHDTATARVAREEGMLDEEMVLFPEVPSPSTSEPPLTVLCVHCDTTSSGRHTPGDTLTCAGCARELGVHRHFSRVHAAWMSSALVTDPGALA
ncbi:hypothetical protein [Brevibacterium litoralis]|uniref:hypothetical protein n=1 Tax=Brevibacterium litoralis TaxID=3138935 RepID=UPI0032EE6055